MNRRLFFLPLIALAASLAGAAPATPPAGTAPADAASESAQKPEMLATKWGELPASRFQAKQLLFSVKSLRNVNKVARLKSTATVDLLINRDGSVGDVVIVEGTGDRAVDRAARASFVGAKFATQIAPDDPAPSVFRRRIVVLGKPKRDTYVPIQSANRISFDYYSANGNGPVDHSFDTGGYSYVSGSAPCPPSSTSSSSSGPGSK